MIVKYVPIRRCVEKQLFRKLKKGILSDFDTIAVRFCSGALPTVCTYAFLNTDDTDETDLHRFFLLFNLIHQIFYSLSTTQGKINSYYRLIRVIRVPICLCG